jgi:hypothetical protein
VIAQSGAVQERPTRKLQLAASGIEALRISMENSLGFPGQRNQRLPGERERLIPQWLCSPSNEPF